VNEVEYRTAALATALVQQSDAADAAVRAAKAMQRARTVTTDRPGGEPTREQQREWALKRARMDHRQPVQAGGPAAQDYLISCRMGRTGRSGSRRRR
jgi:hypothetical protein